MKRVGERGSNQWERISWEEAINTIADAIWEMDEKGDSMQLVCTTGGGGNPQFSRRSALPASTSPTSSSPAAPSATCRATMPSLPSTARWTTPSPTPTRRRSTTTTTWPRPTCCGAPTPRRAARPQVAARWPTCAPRASRRSSSTRASRPTRQGRRVAARAPRHRRGAHARVDPLHHRERGLRLRLLPEVDQPAPTSSTRRPSSSIARATWAWGGEDEYVVWDQKTNAPAAMPYPWMTTSTRRSTASSRSTARRAARASAPSRSLPRSGPWRRPPRSAGSTPAKIEEAIKIYIDASPASGICLGVATDQYEQSAQAAQGATILDVHHRQHPASRQPHPEAPAGHGPHLPGAPVRHVRPAPRADERREHPAPPGLPGAQGPGLLVRLPHPHGA